MLYRVLGLLSICACGLTCKGREPAASTKDEGFFSVGSSSVSELAQRIGKARAWNTRQIQQLQTILLRSIPAVFQIKTIDNHSGTGFFISNQGDFVTASHVLNVSQQVGVVLQSLDAAGKLVFTSMQTDVYLRQQAETDYKFDIAIGRIPNISTPIYFQVPETNLAPEEQDLLISLGFPGQTFRDGAGKEKVTWDFARAEEALVTMSNLLQFFPRNDENEEKFLVRDGFARALSIARKEAGTYPRQKYDLVPADEDYAKGLFLSLGFKQWADAYRLYANNDGVGGFSGGPMLAVADGGRLVGLTTKVSALHFADGKFADEEVNHFYLGVTMAHRLSREKIDSLPPGMGEERSIAQKLTQTEYDQCAKLINGDDVANDASATADGVSRADIKLAAVGSIQAYTNLLIDYGRQRQRAKDDKSLVPKNVFQEFGLDFHAYKKFCVPLVTVSIQKNFAQVFN